MKPSQRRALFLFSLWMMGLTTGLMSGAALAETVANYTSIEAIAGKPVRVSYHASAHRANCTAGSAPTIRVTEPPKRGTLAVRKAVLTTDKVAGCPRLKTPAHVVFYLARGGYEGPDHVKYEVTSENGEVAAYDVTITVKAPPERERAGERSL